MRVEDQPELTLVRLGDRPDRGESLPFGAAGGDDPVALARVHAPS